MENSCPHCSVPTNKQIMYKFAHMPITPFPLEDKIMNIKQSKFLNIFGLQMLSGSLIAWGVIQVVRRQKFWILATTRPPDVNKC